MERLEKNETEESQIHGTDRKESLKIFDKNKEKRFVLNCQLDDLTNDG